MGPHDGPEQHVKQYPVFDAAHLTAQRVLNYLMSMKWPRPKRRQHAVHDIAGHKRFIIGIVRDYCAGTTVSAATRTHAELGILLAALAAEQCPDATYTSVQLA